MQPLAVEARATLADIIHLGDIQTLAPFQPPPRTSHVASADMRYTNTTMVYSVTNVTAGTTPRE